MKKLVLIGGGGHCKSVIDSVRRTNEFGEIVIADPALKVGSDILGCKVIGSDECLGQLRKEGYKYAFITVGNVRVNSIRKMLVQKASGYGYVFPIIIDPSATVADSVTIGPGTFVGKNTIINIDTIIGSQCIINTGAIIEHDSSVGDYTHISVGSVLCGGVDVGKNCMIGSNSTIIQGIKIGNNCNVGAGAVVIEDSPDDCTLLGVPARKKGGIKV